MILDESNEIVPSPVWKIALQYQGFDAERFLLVLRGRYMLQQRQQWNDQLHIPCLKDDDTIEQPLPVKHYGGTERVMFWLMKELVHLGHQPVLIGHPKSKVSEFGIELIPIEKNLTLTALNFVQYIKTIF